MKKIIILLLLVTNAFLFSNSMEEAISQANEFANAGKLEEAAAVLEEANKENPNNPDILVELGNVYSKQAGSTSNFLKAGKLSGKAFSMMDRALVIDPAHINAHLYRGILGANVPAFLGKLQQAEGDLLAEPDRPGDDRADEHGQHRPADRAPEGPSGEGQHAQLAPSVGGVLADALSAGPVAHPLEEGRRVGQQIVQQREPQQ